jgi:hypothetical protein
MRPTQAILIVVVMLIMGCATQKTSIPTGKSVESAADRPAGKEIFAIGLEYKSDLEFRSSGFSGRPEFTCTVGVDCSTQSFPQRLHRAQSSAYAKTYKDAGVERITIKFNLEKAYNNAVLRLARGGGETTVVTIDGKQTYFVTNEMLGSFEGYGVGVYNLILGTLTEGAHIIQLTVADDGKGNGTYQWDALALFATIHRN